jgi:hypothetical protein
VATTRRRLTDLPDAELAQLVDLVRGSDSVELKLTVPEAHHRSTAVALGMDPLEAQIRQVFFFDTPDLALNEAGLVVRARRVQGRGDDSVVKLRPVVPESLPDDLRRSPAMVVEVDAMPGGYVCSATLKARLGTSDVQEVVLGKRSIRKLFTKQQRAFYAAHAPDGIGLDDLSVFGPIFVLKLNFMPQGAKRRIVAEVWQYPDGSRILELSTKCMGDEMFQVAAESRAFLARSGVVLSGEQQTKTRAALEYFSKVAREAGDGDRPTG